MIKKIIFYTFTFCLFIAIPLYAAGFTKVELGNPFLSYLSFCNDILNDYNIAIPDIPLIPSMKDIIGDANGLEVLFKILDILISFFNSIITFINIIADIINVIISLIEFLCIMISSLIYFKDNIIDYNTSSVLTMII